MILKLKKKKERQYRRIKRVRKRVRGTSERPRLTIYKSNRYIYAQIIDDTKGITLCAASSLDKEFNPKLGKDVESAKKVGELIAKRALDKGIKRVVFDRRGYKYHGRVKALADSAREAGLDF